jgi:hypothetical protein
LGGAVVFALLLTAAVLGGGYVVVARRFHQTPEYQWRKRVFEHSTELRRKLDRLTSSKPPDPEAVVNAERRLALQTARQSIPVECLMQQSGIGPWTIALLRQSGIDDLPTVLRANLEVISGVGPQKAALLRAAAQQHLNSCSSDFLAGRSPVGDAFNRRIASLRIDTTRACERHTNELATLLAAFAAHQESEQLASEVTLLGFLRDQVIIGLDAERMQLPFPTPESPQIAPPPSQAHQVRKPPIPVKGVEKLGASRRLAAAAEFGMFLVHFGGANRNGRMTRLRLALQSMFYSERDAAIVAEVNRHLKARRRPEEWFQNLIASVGIDDRVSLVAKVLGPEDLRSPDEAKLADWIARRGVRRSGLLESEPRAAIKNESPPSRPIKILLDEPTTEAAANQENSRVGSSSKDSADQVDALWREFQERRYSKPADEELVSFAESLWSEVNQRTGKQIASDPSNQAKSVPSDTKESDSRQNDLLQELIQESAPLPKVEPTRRHPQQNRLEALARFGVMIALADGRAAQAELRLVRSFLAELFGHEPDLLRRIDPLVELCTVAKPFVDHTIVEAKRVVASDAELSRLYQWATQITDASSGRNDRESALLDRIAKEWNLAAPSPQSEALAVASPASSIAPAAAVPPTDLRTELGIPADAEITVELVRRRYSLVVDQLDAARLDGLGEEFASLAALKREKVEAAALALLHPFGATLAPPQAPPPSNDLRHNPDLDAVFGA